MPAVPVSPDEAARLLDLTRYHILDTPAEEVFDRIARLAARLLEVPIAAVNFVDTDRQWSKARLGLDPQEVPREASFCAWTVLNDAPLAVPDLREDERFAANPGVAGRPHLRMYAGAPLRTPLGHRIGTLCVMDTEPRCLNDQDLQALQDLAAMAMSELELRAHVQHLQRQLNGRLEYEADLRRSLDHARTLEAVGELMDLPLEPSEVAWQAADLIGQAIGADWTGLMSFQGGVPRAVRVNARPGLPPALLDLATRLHAGRGGVSASLEKLSTPLYLDDYATHPRAMPEAVAAGLQAAAWVPLGRWAETTYLLLAFRMGQDIAERQPWRHSDRVLLEAAARSVSAALLRRSAANAQARLARQDALTGVLNRRAFDEDLSAAQEAGTPFTLALSDLDGFKALNDAEGHAQGDKVLRIFAAALQAEVQPRGQVYRLGGDEFVLLMPGVWAEEDVLELLDVAVLAARQGAAGRIGVSAGVVHTGDPAQGGMPATEVVERADALMYEVKRRRKALLTQG
ncbi:diguanylate cyclase domain-containing protein [Deinococcus navajonensis]|uniref:Diguanylate cyclase domain-containing protein n=1 Tax=Deinococcus navajonensis TaxID=309884 RepID=A0ABV8XMB9_9DEIO